ncbi:DNA cytosine methyltransferase (plasmid) [Microtetraspora malaysiensis]|uniref:DNA cytosine methyltransferase n=1 Tax=Microtetraspora malaysiensis TaxID=161358 RepID=UPI003D922D03
MDWFCGAGGSSQGAHAVPYIRVALAANHWKLALDTHATNFPNAQHEQGDIREADVHNWPIAMIHWASPECTKWSIARGVKRTFHNENQTTFFDLPMTEEELEQENADRESRALSKQVTDYLEGVISRGGLVLCGVVENVVDEREWSGWDDWIRRFHRMGYRTRLVALNSMHAQPVHTLAAPQSRDRLYLVYWHESIGRTPDFNKWLRPWTYCPTCDEMVQAVQAFKDPTRDMGRYRAQYLYRCPRVKCRNAAIEPPVLPAAAAIDWSNPGKRIGDRDKPLAPKTMARIEAGLKKYARPITLEAAGHTFERRPGVRTWPVDAPLTAQTTTATKAMAAPPMMVPTGGTWREEPTSVTEPMPTRTTRENDGVAIPPFLTLLRSGRPRNIGLDQPLATVVADGSNHGLVVPPLIVPMEGRDGKQAAPATEAMRTQTGRAENALAFLPFIAELRGGNSETRPVSEALATVTASGNHHGLTIPPGFVMRNNGSQGNGGEHCTDVAEPMRTLTTKGHQSLVTWEQWQTLLAPYYGNGQARPVEQPMGALSTRDRYAMVSGDAEIDPMDVFFRMLDPHEVGRGMAFTDGYVVLGNKRERVKQYGNAVTPPAAEVLVSLLVECLTGEELERFATPLATC